MGLAFRRRSKLVQTFSSLIIERMPRINKLLDIKYGSRCREHFYPEKASPQTGYKALNIMAVSGAFVLWAVMIGVALLVLLYEHYFTVYAVYAS